MTIKYEIIDAALLQWPQKSGYLLRLCHHPLTKFQIDITFLQWGGIIIFKST